MNSQQYWRYRVLYQKRKQLASAAEYELAMKSRLKDLEHEFEKEALKYTQRYANENNVSLKQAASVLNSVDNHKWSMSLKEFEAKAKAGGFDRVLNSEYYRSRIARLQDLHNQLAEVAKKYSATESIRMRDELVKTYQETYLQDWYVHDKLEGKLSVNVNHFNEDQLESIVYQPWQGSDFSKRIWHNYTNVLPEVLTDALMRATVMGYSPSRTIRDFRDRFNDVSSKNVHRLIITELGHIQEQATAKFYEDSDIEQYQYLATLESHTCDECAHLDERIFNVKDRVPGKNYPLIHPYCRCTTVPYIKGITGGEDRWYRDPITGKGKWTKDMTFNQWKQKQGIKPIKRLGQLTALSAIQAILPQPKLTRDEERTLKQYISSDSYKINDALRNGTPLTTEQQIFVNNLDSALNKIPKYNANKPLQRDYFFTNNESALSLLDQMDNGWFEDPAYISTSKVHYGEGLEQIHVIIKKSKSGRDISTYNPNEQEVLFPRNIKFKITDYYVNEENIPTIVWEEDFGE